MSTKTQSQRKRQELALLLEQSRVAQEANQQEENRPAPVRPPENGANGRGDELAIIGMAGRFPDSPNLATFWTNLQAGKNLIHEIPPARWVGLAADGTPDGLNRQTTVRHMGALDNPFTFDAQLFGLAPREAEAMDPHQRVLLEVVWEAIEQAGYAPTQLAGTKTGVFIAMYNNDFVAALPNRAWEPESLPYLVTGASQAIVGNRISYLFNLQGPSEIISTACSSALVALHKAAQAIRAGDCTMALVGGVSLLLSPARMGGLETLGILSTQGYCAPFDKDSPGEVLGEGAGVVLLKPLRQAERDGDTIHAILKATGTNHHGNGSGSLTMPSVQAQRDLVVDTYRRAKLDPRTIGFIEAHGSGNIGGDKVELLAFQRAFTALAREKQVVLAKHVCGIGSGKGNIGFLEAAGGMAQLFKVILAMQQQTLPATLHFKAVDESLNLADSPFYIVDKTMPWPAFTDEHGQILPRRGALHAYGLGGTNAHVVVEEYPQPGAAKHNDGAATPPYLMVLSAKSQTQLKAIARNLQQYLSHQTSFNAEALASIAYTLQVGRAALEHRLAFSVTDLNTLRQTLDAYLAGGEEVAQLATGYVEKAQTLVNVFTQDEELQALVGQWVHKGKLHKLAQLWVAGLEIDWRLLYPQATPTRVPLPTYPFAQETYHLPAIRQDATNSQVLHPLLHQNISDLAEQRFRSHFQGHEFFLTDHQVLGTKVLPGVVYLEMARAAGERSLPGQRVTQLREVVWISPIACHQAPLEVQIGLAPDGKEAAESGTVGFVIRRHTAPEPTVHCQGKLAVTALAQPKALDLVALQARCHSTVTGAACYQHFSEHGMVHGPAMQGLTQLAYNTQEALAQICLPAQAPQAGYGLHPSLLDAALVATMGLVINQEREGQPVLHLPFAVQTINLYRPLPENAYAYVQYHAAARAQEAGQAPNHNRGMYDITLTDAEGIVCVTIQGFSTRAVQQTPATALAALPSREDHEEATPKQQQAALTNPAALYFVPEWQANSLPETHARPSDAPATTTLLLVGLDEQLVAAVAAAFPSRDYGQVKLVAYAPAEIQSGAALIQQSWPHMQPPAPNQAGRPHQVLVVVPETTRHADTGEPHWGALLAALLQTAQRTHPTVRGKLITVVAPDAAQMLLLLHQEMQPDTFQQLEIRYPEAARRLVKSWRMLTDEPQATVPYLRPHGVYWITGGLGGLGQIFTRHLLAQGEKITVILSGRTAVDENGLADASQQVLAELKQTGGRVFYLPVDVSQRQAVAQAVQAIKTTHGALHGIIHCAGTLGTGLRDAKPTAAIDSVLAPKVAGLLNLDAATQHEPLDFMVLFSSASGVLGHPGYADYAAANAFLDSFAQQRQALVAAGQRAGHTLAINWPFWAEGGMAVDRQTLTFTEHVTGLRALPTPVGLHAFARCMAAQESQVLVAFGDEEKIRRTLLSNERSRVNTRSPQRRLTGQDEALAAQVQGELTAKVATLLKVDAATLAADESLLAYGATSITIMALTNHLNQRYALELMPTLFFEYNTLAALSRYLAEQHAERLRAHYQTQAAANTGAATAITAVTPTSRPARRFRSAPEQVLPSPAQAQQAVTPTATAVAVSAHSALVPIQTTGTRLPFFCVHPWAGVVYPYYALAAALGTEQPFYGLQAVGLYQAPQTAIAEMASHYLAALRQAQPVGPYALGGWSLGGVIAYEMAQQLQQRGEAVSLLALFDTYAPLAEQKLGRMAATKFLMTEAAPYIWPYVRDYLRLRAASAEDMAVALRPTNGTQATHRTTGWQLTKGMVKELGTLTSAQSTLRRIASMLQVGLHALATYQAQPYPGTVTLFRTGHQLTADQQDQTLGWHRLAKQGVVVQYVPGRHLTLLQQPHVLALAGQLRTCLEQIADR